MTGFDDPRLKDPKALLRQGWRKVKEYGETFFEHMGRDGKVLQRYYRRSPGYATIELFDREGEPVISETLLELGGLTRHISEEKF